MLLLLLLYSSNLKTIITIFKRHLKKNVIDKDEIKIKHSVYKKLKTNLTKVIGSICVNGNRTTNSMYTLKDNAL